MPCAFFAPFWPNTNQRDIEVWMMAKRRERKIYKKKQKNIQQRIFLLPVCKVAFNTNTTVNAFTYRLYDATKCADIQTKTRERSEKNERNQQNHVERCCCCCTCTSPGIVQWRAKQNIKMQNKQTKRESRKYGKKWSKSEKEKRARQVNMWNGTYLLTFFSDRNLVFCARSVRKYNIHTDTQRYTNKQTNERTHSSAQSREQPNRRNQNRECTESEREGAIEENLCGRCQ